MKHCPHCKIQVGGDGEYCPLCQSPLVGEGTALRYPVVEPPYRRSSKLYQVIAFVLTAAGVVTATVDFLLTDGEHLHWSILVLVLLAAALFVVRTAMKRRYNAPKLLFQLLVGTSLIFAFFDWFLAWGGISVRWIIPIICSATLLVNFVLAFVNRKFTENGLVYLLLNMVVGVVPYIALSVRGTASQAWVICLMDSIITFLGLVIFKGRVLLAELQKRLHL